MSNFESPIPLSDIESVLEWVDTFKLSRPTKKINRDFSDAVLLAEILSVYYPKLVEMHNYPPRNSHSLKLNNWLTLNRKVLKKLKLNLCINTMEQLANCANGVIERVLIMVREKIRRDEELNKSMKDSEQNLSSGGSYYEACGEDDNVLVVPVKTRVNGVLETVQQKVVSHESYLTLREELKDARDCTDLLKQKVEHLDNLLKLKDERIDELQKQLDRKQARRKEAEAFQNSLQVPFETVPSPVTPNINEIQPAANLVMKIDTPKALEPKLVKEESKIPVKPDSTIKSKVSKPSITEVTNKDLEDNPINLGTTKASYTTFSVKSFLENQKINPGSNKASFTTFPVKSFEELRNTFDAPNTKPNFTEVVVNNYVEELDVDLDRIKSDVFKEIEIVDDKVQDFDEFKDSMQDTVMTIEQTIQKEIKNITNPMEFMEDLNC